MIKFHSLPENQQKSLLFDITVNGKTIKAEYARVSAMPFNTPWPGHQRDKSQTEESAFISFESDEKIVLNITTTEKIKKAIVRPLSEKIKVDIISDNSLCFELSKIGQYVLEVNGIHNPLTIFYNPVKDYKAESDLEAQKGRKVYYFGPGVHEIGNLEIESHSTVTIDAGAICYGSISAFSAEDIKINGYGVLDGSFEIRTSNNLLIPLIFNEAPYNGQVYYKNDRENFLSFMKQYKVLNGLLRFYFSKNIVCEGVILRDSATFCVVPAACDNVVFDNLKTIGMWRYNSDGIDIFNSSNVTVKNCFLRNFDDAMVIKGILGWDFKSNENITVDNCVIWCDWGAACEIGAETNAPEFKNIVFKNCDLLYDASGSMMRIHQNNYASIHNIKYENMHCEYHADQMNPIIQMSDDSVYEYIKGIHPGLINIMFVNQGLYGRDTSLGDVYDVEYKDIYVYLEDGVENTPEIRFTATNEQNSIKNVTLENFYINDKRVNSMKEFDLKINDYAYDVKFK